MGGTWEYAGSSDQPRRVNVDNTGQPLAVGCATSVGDPTGSYHAISADGRVIFWTCAGGTAVYARVSTPGQAERDLSVPEQIDSVKRHCEARKWPVVAVFKDEGVSGGKQVKRTQFQQMMTQGAIQSAFVRR